MKSTIIKIIGAAAGSAFTSRKRAEILVERGTAEWVTPGKTIALHEHNPIVTTKAGTHFDARIAGAYQPYFGTSVGYAVLNMEHTIREPKSRRE